MLSLGGAANDEAEARVKLADAIASGRAVPTAERMIEAQGGDPGVVADRARVPVAPEEIVIESPRDGFVVQVDALVIGLAAVAMGAGRTRADQAVDHGVGILVDKKRGSQVARGEPLARLRVRTGSDTGPIVGRVLSAFEFADVAPAPCPLLLDRIDVGSTSGHDCD
jgi:pyrimidine-nucleoside phosphorylase